MPTPAERRAAGSVAPSVRAKLRLVEFLIDCEDPSDGARRALEWLGEHGGVRQAVCLGIDDDPSRAVPLATYRIAPSRVDQLSLDLDAPDHPLVQALASATPIVLGGHGDEARLARLLAFRSPTFVAAPFHGLTGDKRMPGGLFLLSPGSPDVARVAEWVTEIIGHKLARLQWQRRLVRERAQLEAIVDAVSDPVLFTDSQGKLIIANPPAEVLFVSKPEDSDGRRRAVTLNNMLFSAAVGESALYGAAPERRELLLVDPAEGTDLLFELISSQVWDPREGMGMVSILRNVADLRRATEEIEANYSRLRAVEAEVRAERDRLDLIIDSVADPIVVTDAAGNTVMMNLPAERLFSQPAGARDEEAQRVRSNDAHFTSFVSNVFLRVSDLRYQGGIQLVDPRTGAPVPVEAIAGKIISEQHGELVAVVTILHDQTEAIERERLYDQLKLASEELERKVREATSELVRQNELLRRQAMELEQASALKSQFLANMSHEFRTPLNAILGYTSLVLRGVVGSLTPDQADSMTRVDSNARHLLAIINDILDLSRIESGRLPLHRSWFRVPELIAEVMAELEPLVAPSGLSVVAETASSLPRVRSDRPKVKQVLLNLLSNAIKFTPRGSVTVISTYRRASREIAVAIADTGIGIAPEEQGRVFEDFHQVDSSPTRERGGAGLGLSICRRLAVMLGGTIELESKPGEGSTFTLVLPAREAR